MLPDAEPYTDEEFPQWSKNIRRSEIIAFGSLPFVTLTTTLVYSMYRYYEHDYSYGYLPSPFAKSSDDANLDTDEQMKILGYSCAISAGLGVLDLVLTLMRQRRAEKQKKLINQQKGVVIEPLDLLSAPDMMPEQLPDYLYGGMRSVLF